MSENHDHDKERDPQARWYRSLRWATMGFAVGLVATGIWAIVSGPRLSASRTEPGVVVGPSTDGEAKTLGDSGAV